MSRLLSKLPFLMGVSLLATSAAAQAPAASSPGIAPLVHFEAVTAAQPNGDMLSQARRLAAAIVAQDKTPPKSIADIGANTGEFLEAFMERFPDAAGQWSEGEDKNYPNASKRLNRFGERIDYLLGCSKRDVKEGCLPYDVDVILTSWLTIHKDLAGVREYYGEAAKVMKSGGWVVNLDHVGRPTGGWDKRLDGARTETAVSGVTAVAEGPAVHHAEYVTPTLDEQLAAMDAAGFDAQVVWQRLDTVLLMGKKR